MINNMGMGSTHDVSPPRKIAGACIAVAAILSLANPAYAGEIDAPDGYAYEKTEKKKKSKFSGTASIYTQALYPNGTVKSGNPGAKIEGKWKLGKGFYAGVNATKSFSEKGEGTTNFGNTIGLKGGYKTKTNGGIKINTWGSLVDTEKGGFGDVNFAKVSTEASKGILSANGYIAGIEGKYGEWSTGYGIGGDIELIDYIPTDIIDSFRIGGETGLEEKKGYDFTELHMEISKKIQDHTYATIKWDRQIEGSLEGDDNIRIELKYKF